MQRKAARIGLACCYLLAVQGRVGAFGFGAGTSRHAAGRLATTALRATEEGEGENADGGTYESSSTATKGLVSSLTSLANSIFGNAPSPAEAGLESSDPPASPEELLARIRDDYEERNYLWTGDLDVSSFASGCTFTDPTLSFRGVDKYVENVGNLVPVIDFLLGEERECRSELLEIRLNDNESYVETRWNMVGRFDRLPWRPRIDVVGRTKFRYEDEGGVVKVRRYDEEWEVPASLALLQLVTPAGTIPNSTQK